jgi:hypothetical protein
MFSSMAKLPEVIVCGAFRMTRIEFEVFWRHLPEIGQAALNA